MSELERIATAANPEAEALIDLMEPHEKRWIEPALRRALAAERRATVERLSEKLFLATRMNDHTIGVALVQQWLDEEAQR